MEKELLRRLEEGTLICSRCHLTIPFGFKKEDPSFTVPSFTMVNGSPVCYRSYHPVEFSSIIENRKAMKKKLKKTKAVD